MTRRRHPAQASRIVTAGLGTATMLGIVAVLGAHPAGAPQAPPEAAPARVVLVVRVPAAKQAGRRAPAPRVVAPPTARAPHTTTRPS